MNRRSLTAVTIVTVALSSVAGLGIALWRSGRGPSDEERIRAVFGAMARAAEERRPGEVVRWLSDRFQGQGLDKDGARRFVTFETMRGAWTSVSVAGANVLIEGDRAVAAVDVVAARGGAGRALADLLPAQASPWRARLELARHGSGWLITSASWHQITLGEAMAGPPAAR